MCLNLDSQLLVENHNMMELGPIVEFYPSQTKMLEGGTKDAIRISKEALFQGVSTLFGLRIVEKSVENRDFLFCSSFPNLRLGSMKLFVRGSDVSKSRDSG